MVGIPGTTEVLKFVCDILDDYKAAKADGSVNLLDLPKFSNLLPHLRNLVTEGKLIPGELQDLDAVESNVLLALLAEALGKVLSVVLEVQ